MQYWINHNGVQSGPVGIDELKAMELTSKAYVWHEGLTDWVKITQLPELQGMYELLAEEPVEAVQGEPVAPAEEQPAAQPAAAAPVDGMPPIPQPDEPILGQPYQQPGAPAGQPYGQQPYSPQYGYNEPQKPQECPSTNLVWAIIATVLCCIPTGIVAIVYALKVSNLYHAGDIAGAQRASETGAWWCIASAVLGIISMPFLMMVQSMAMGSM